VVKLWARLRESVEFTAYVATIGAIIFAIHQFKVTESEYRVNATLNYVARFNSQLILDAFNRLYDAWESTPSQESEPNSTVDPTAEQIRFIEERNLKSDAVLLGDFFDQLYVCVTRDICDENLAVTMLGRDIETVYVLAGDYLTRRTYTGCGLEALFEVVHPRLDFSRLKPEEKVGKRPPDQALRPNACPTI
jgi:hypothetical protein